MILIERSDISMRKLSESTLKSRTSSLHRKLQKLLMLNINV